MWLRESAAWSPQAIPTSCPPITVQCWYQLTNQSTVSISRDHQGPGDANCSARDEVTFPTGELFSLPIGSHKFMPCSDWLRLDRVQPMVTWGATAGGVSLLRSGITSAVAVNPAGTSVLVPALNLETSYCSDTLQDTAEIPSSYLDTLVKSRALCDTISIHTAAYAA